MKRLKRFLASLLVFTLLIMGVSENVYAMGPTSSNDEIVYIDGVAFSVTTDYETGIISVRPKNGKRGDVLEIFPDGHGEASTYDVQAREYCDYELNITNLTSENVDLDIISDDGELVNSIDSYEELVGDTYQGQAAVTVVVGISVETLITALIAAAACILVAGILYYAGRAAVEELSREKTNTNQYFKAYIYEQNVFIDLYNRISRDSAVARIRAGLNVYTLLRPNAKAITQAAGLGVEGPEISCLRGKVMFHHYHVGRRANSAHIFYGAAVINN